MTSTNRPAATLETIAWAFVLLTCLRIWTGPLALESSAKAQLPNPAAQRANALAETRRTNELLTEIRDLLQKGTLHVRLEQADKHPDTNAQGG